MNLKGKKVLVTGGAGFIGSHTVDALIKEGASVVVVDDLSTGQRENLNSEATFYEINLADPKIEEIMDTEKPDIIYHFAFNVLVPKSVENPLIDMDVLVGSLRLLQKAKALKVQKFFLASSGLLYGNNLNLPLTEAEPISPVSPYVVSKRALEHYLEFYRNTYGLPYVVLRYATVYGPRQVKGAMADYIQKLSSGQQADIWGDGTKTRDYVYISDVVKANLLALDVPDDFEDPIFNIGRGKETTLNELYAKIATIVGAQSHPTYHSERAGEHMRFALNSDKMQKTLLWHPEVELDEGLKKVIESWKK